MTTVHEELHTLIEQLSEDEAGFWLHQIREDIDKPKIELGAWLEEARKLREELAAKYGSFPSAADFINELREERLNELMGSE